MGENRKRSSKVEVQVTYRPKKGMEARFRTILEGHWPTLRRARLAASSRPRIYLAKDKRTSRTFFIESFAWKDESASDLAHESPIVKPVWDAMMPLLESMELAVISPITPRSKGPSPNRRAGRRKG